MIAVMRRLTLIGLCSGATLLAIYSIHKTFTTSPIKELSRDPVWELVEERRQMALPKAPPPPPMPGPTDPPRQITRFFAGEAAEVRLTIFVLASKPEGALRKQSLFLGQPIAKTTKVPTRSVENIIDKLGARESYGAGGIGCIYPTGYGIRLTRNNATLDFELNCGHLFFTAQGHEGPLAYLSEEMTTEWNTLLEELDI